MPELHRRNLPRSTPDPGLGVPAADAAFSGAKKPAGEKPAGALASGPAGNGLAERLRAAVLGGELPPGSKLSEQALGVSLCVSRNTLREAFAVLSAERIVTRIPNRGVFVAKPSRTDVAEMYRIRRILEPAALLQGRQATVEAGLAAAVRQGLDARGRNDIPGMAAANQQFHALVVGLAGSARLDALMSHIQQEMRLVFHAMDSDPAFHAPFSSQNAEILALWQAGQGGQAAEKLSNYLAAAQEQVLAAMPNESRGY